MSLGRIPLTLIVTCGLHVCLTNPNPGVSDEERKTFAGSAGFKGNVITWYPNIVKYAQWAGALCEIAVILASKYPHAPPMDCILSTLTMKPESAASVRVTPQFLAGFSLAAIGSFIRYRCYRTLGRHFTYQLAFRKDHQLVTWGPYAYVRHPSYIAFITAFAGVCVCWFSPGSWLTECGILDTQTGRWVVGVLLAVEISLVGICVARPAREDRALRSQFGEQWDKWARRVPYRLVPYVY
ncbi:hypothetical protein GLOTRDRAFT_60323 [Gloeophyllum trabeum ATCC 11539]|uniref:Protein-S-isoprenylcysteine O-methyltransferase n=1 Tax=Gloeophyllum trabeum (strain ATCC 11539 / FP-39264 / Madison 617) TaxID=670483 RepID=S7Q7S6_GLOTA|nr:uncharacterized protein GLOTRDRAFT_60323 [Gloeophyllum trabeum ATCC 11539]EPQ55587.1 hypothetical protein GLOTRDRAFT_60323 [Gloeophyllum trabeum ATCC 11539]